MIKLKTVITMTMILSTAVMLKSAQINQIFCHDLREFTWFEISMDDSILM